MELKTLKDFDSVTINSVGHVNKNELKQSAIDHIKKIELAKAWRCYGLGGNVHSAMWKRKFPKPKEEMSEDQIRHYLQFGGLTDDIPCNWIKEFFNIEESDLE